MSSQPESADESLPSPTPDETARLMREGPHSKVPWWKRLLPPWAFSIGLHLFLLPFVLVVTITFADKLFVPTVWNDVRDEKLGNDPYSLVIEDRDFPVEQVQEKIDPLVKPTERRSDTPATQPTTAAKDAKDIGPKTASPSTGPVATTPEMQLPFEYKVAETRGTFVSLLKGAFTVALPDGTERIFRCDDFTQVVRENDPRFFQIDGGIHGIAAPTPLKIISRVKNGEDFALVVMIGVPVQAKQPQAGSDGNFAVQQPAASNPAADKVQTKSDSLEIRGTLIGTASLVSKQEFRMRLAVKKADGEADAFDCDENTKLFREDDSRFLPLSFDSIPLGTALRIQYYAKEGKNVALAVFAKLPAQKE